MNEYEEPVIGGPGSHVPPETIRWMLTTWGEGGLTALEIQGALGMDDSRTMGKVTGALSVMHERGQIARLRKEYDRGGCHVYVGLLHVAGRPTVAYARHLTSVKLNRLFGSGSWTVYADTASGSTRAYDAEDLDALERP